MTKHTPVNTHKSLGILLSLCLILANIAFFYFYSISLRGVIVSLIYFIVAVILPGYFMTLLFVHIFSLVTDDHSLSYLTPPLLTVFGIANVLISYLVGQAIHIHEAYYFFLWSYLILIFKPVRILLKTSLSYHLKSTTLQNTYNLPIFLFFVFTVNIFLFLIRPTPGILPLDIFHDHLWNAANTVSLVSDFPLRSLSIETKPYLAYHILIHILGAHMALITCLTPHMVGLQFVFIPLVPLLIFNMIALLNQFIKRANIYLFYGLAVLLFGGGFHLVHEVKVYSLLKSSTNFIGVILLFSVVTLFLQFHRLKKVGRFISIFIGLFLATVAKGSIGASLIVGITFWVFAGIWKKNITNADVVGFIGAILGFFSSYLLFFVLPIWGQPVASDWIQKGLFQIIPLSYVTQNSLANPFVWFISNWSPDKYQALLYIILTILILPIHVLLYYSYRLLVFYDIRINGIREEHQKVLFVVLGSLLIAYLVAGGAQDHAYFIISALYLLDILFIVYIQKEAIFSKIRNFYCNKDIYSLIGISVIIIAPFITVGWWMITPEYSHNFIVYGKIGQLMDSKFQKTKYRREHQSITPELYDALQYIRKFAGKNDIVVSPFTDIEDGRHLAFYISAFGEHPVFLEGYEFGVRKYTELSEINEKVETINEIYNHYEVPLKMMNGRYIFIINNNMIMEFQSRYKTKILFKNGTFSVIQIYHRK